MSDVGFSIPAHRPPRVIIESVNPQIDCGQFPIKRVVGEFVEVSADIFAEGHDHLAAVVLHRAVGEDVWHRAPMSPVGNDRWTGRFQVSTLGWHEYSIEAWVDHFTSLAQEITKKHEAGQLVSSELLEAARLVRQASTRAHGHADHAAWLNARASEIESEADQPHRVGLLLDPELAARMAVLPDLEYARRLPQSLRVQVERQRARFGAWYEMFPRSAAPEPGRHGTLRDVANRLPYIASMGFDVLYLPPIHPIGRAFRKGPNNSLTHGPDDPGSPWAIGSAEGGHTAIHPQLGSFEDFDQLVESASKFGLEIALDIAFQCSPDHPWVTEHPEWFRHRPDGTIKYAENPPKKYQDIYPINFETEHWQSLWIALRDVFTFWIERGVHIFRVDNPHTKSLPFWNWCLHDIWTRHPKSIFLSEAFTRPKLMRHLAKAGFTQSYTYFTWRNDKHGLSEYFHELTQTECAEYLRPNLFANTPDILHEYLQTGGRPAFLIRLILAATLGATYGIYGPPFELAEGTPVRPGSEEYLDSEKYQLRTWDLNAPHTLRDDITRINTIRRLNPALRDTRNLRFFHVDNPNLLCYGKATPDLANLIIVVVNLDPHWTQSGWVTLPVDELRLTDSGECVYQMHDLLSDARYTWRGQSNFVMLNPHHAPAHVFRVRRKIRGERDYEYFE